MRLKLFGVLFMLGWTTVISLSLWWNLDHQNEARNFTLFSIARNIAIQGGMFRNWNTSVDGVYVRTSELVVPNPHIMNLSKRDIPTPDGKTLTLVNVPAMFHQVAEIAAREGHNSARVVSLDAFQPELVPDEWEKKALARLQEGAGEFGSEENVAGQRYFRFMLPLYTDKGCLTSRGGDNYSIGDLIAGISVSVPLAEFNVYDKSYKVLLVKAHAIIWFLGFVGLVLSFRRISREFNARLGAERERRNLIEEKELLLNAAGEGIFGVDTRGSHTFVNPAAAQMLGHDAGSMIGKNSHLLCHHTKKDGTLYPEEECPIYQAFIDGKIHQGDDEIFWRRDGTSFPVSYTSQPIKKNDAIVGAVVTFKDISQKIEVEEEQRKLQEQLTQAQKMEMIGRLAGGVAHDFNNMLTVIFGYSWFAHEKAAGDPELAKDLSVVLKTCKKAEALVSQLMAFSRKQVIALQPVDLDGLIQKMGEMFSRLVEEDITVDIRKPSSPLQKVWGDPGQIEQILMNLVVNARDAMPEGGRITVRMMNFEIDDIFCAANRGAKLGCYVMISVEDTGIGIPTEIQQKIFEPFFTTKGLGKGTGLGLSMVYGIVKQLNGYITLDSRVGEGSVFKIYLPVTTEKEKKNIDAAAGEVVGGNETILLVEDESDLADMLEKQLALLGYKVFKASDAEQAIEVAASHGDSIDLLLTDIVLPGINGRELAEKIIAGNPRVKALFMSGYTDDMITERGIRLSMINFINKPFSIKELGGKLREVLEGGD